MTDKKRSPQERGERCAEQEPVSRRADTADSSDGKKEPASRKAALLEKRLAEMEAETAKLNEEICAKDDKYLRLAAEYDNFRKRMQKEKDCAYSDAAGETLAKLLPVLDNLERAARFEPATDSAEQALSEGICKILRQFLDILEKMDVKEIPAKGKPFDPELHHAVLHEEDENLGENLVSEVLIKGYTLGGKVIRYSAVKVVN